MYKIVMYSGSQTGVLRIADNTYIPLDPANTDYQQYLKWLEEGNQPLPADTATTDNPT